MRERQGKDFEKTREKGEDRVQKIENPEKRTLKGAERGGVWRRGDKGRGLMRKIDKYGAMHHSGNTGRTKTLSHETGKTLRYFSATAAVRWHFAFFSSNNSARNNRASLQLDCDQSLCFFCCG